MLRSKKLEIRKKKSENLKDSIKNKTKNRKIESNPSNNKTKHEGDNPSFLDEFTKHTFSLTVQFVFLSKMKEGELDIPSHFYFSST
jgi:hypothetical protein